MSAKRITVDGCAACAHVVHTVNEIITIYPITPSTPIAEICDAKSAAGKKNIWRPRRSSPPAASARPRRTSG